MAVTETLDALGSWELQLYGNVPSSVLDKLTYFGHICIDIGSSQQQLLSDGMLKTSRYVGVMRDKEGNGDSYKLSGAGMALWLGDEDQKGYVFETPLVITAQSFANSIRAVLPTSVHEGTLFGTIAGLFTNTFQYTDPRTALDYICSTMGGEWRVNGDATLDAGLVSDLYRQTPNCALVRADLAGADMLLRALPGAFDAAQDVEDFTTRVLLLGQGDSGSTLNATADIAGGLNPFKDMFGNALKLTRMVSESTTDATNATARAQLQLNRFTSARNALTLSTTEYDIKGDIRVGDNLYVYDPSVGLIDNTKEVIFRGERLNPVTLRCTELTWPVVNGMTVGFRDYNGNWTDLTPYVNFETGQTTVVVGGYDRSLVSTSEPIGSRPLPDSSVPNAPAWVTPFVQAVYQSATNGQTRAQVQLVWSRPTNTDGSVILDGDHYEIRYRTSSSPIYPATHAQLAAYTYAQLAGHPHNQLIQYPVTDYTHQTVGFDQLTALIQELIPSMPYEAQIRAVDSANPPNFSAWSSLTSWQTSADTIPPTTPAPPAVASSLIAVQITHTLGVASGGTYNLEGDLHHLEVHGAYEPTFSPVDTTLLGKLIANNGMITGQIPATGTFQVNQTSAMYFKVIAVDDSGNKSSPSSAVQSTVTLIDNAHISDLTVSKVTAGTITSDWIVGARIKTGNTGARVELNTIGLQAYDAANNQTAAINSADGSIVIQGVIQSGGTAGTKRVILNPKVSGALQSEVRWYTGNNVNDPYVYVAASTNVAGAFGNGAEMSIANSTGPATGAQLARMFITDFCALLGFQAAGGTPDAYFQIQNDGSHHWKGTVNRSDSISGQSVYSDDYYIAGTQTGNGGVGVGPGATMATLYTVLGTTQSNAGNWFTGIYNINQTSFAVSWQRPVGTGTDFIQVNWHCARFT